MFGNYREFESLVVKYVEHNKLGPHATSNIRCSENNISISLVQKKDAHHFGSQDISSLNRGFCC